MPEPCGLCGVPVEQGATVFGVVEMGVSGAYFLWAFHRLSWIIHLSGSFKAPRDVEWINTFVMLGGAICGCLLYFLGIRMKNAIMCWVWIGVAILRILWAFAYVGVFEFGDVVALGLLYLFYGIWIIFAFTRGG